MNSLYHRLATSLAALALCASVAAAQEAARPTAAPQADAADRPSTHSPYRSQVFEIKHREPRSLVEVLGPLGSGSGGATAAVSNEFHTITVRDFPENLAAIGEAIKRLDVPEEPRSDIEIHIHILLASPTGTTGDLPPEIKNAVAQLQNTLNFKGFVLLAPIVQRAQEGEAGGVGGGGEVSPTGGPGVVYNYAMDRVMRSTDTAGVSRVELSRFRFILDGNLGKAQVNSNLSLRDGEQVVVGTAMLRNGQALVLIVSARAAK